MMQHCFDPGDAGLGRGAGGWGGGAPWCGFLACSFHRGPLPAHAHTHPCECPLALMHARPHAPLRVPTRPHARAPTRTPASAHSPSCTHAPQTS
jgi:hypothetical protein